MAAAAEVEESQSGDEKNSFKYRNNLEQEAINEPVSQFVKPFTLPSQPRRQIFESPPQRRRPMRLSQGISGMGTYFRTNSSGDTLLIQSLEREQIASSFHCSIFGEKKLVWEKTVCLVFMVRAGVFWERSNLDGTVDCSGVGITFYRFACAWVHDMPCGITLVQGRRS